MKNQNCRAVVGPLDATVVPQCATPARRELTGAEVLADMKRRPAHQQPEWLRRDPATAPEGLLFFPAGATWPDVDAELHAVGMRYIEKARLARESAKRHKARGDLVRWRKANAVARVWELAHSALWQVACPF